MAAREEGVTMAGTWWSVLVEVEGPKRTRALDPGDPRLGELMTTMESHSGSVSGGGRGYSVRLSVLVEDDAEAVTLGRALVRAGADAAGLPAWSVVRLEAVTDDLLGRDLAQPAMPELLGMAEVAVRLAVSRQRVAELRRRPDFPQPWVDLAAGPVWFGDAIDRFLEGWERKPGRPAKSA